MISVFYLAAFGMAFLSLTRRMKLRRWLLSIFVFCVAIVAIDTTFRLLEVNIREISLLKRYDPEFGVINTPGLKKEVTFDGAKNGDMLNIYGISEKMLQGRTRLVTAPRLSSVRADTEKNTFNYEIDSQGFRNPPGNNPQESGVWIIGDSQTIASSLPLEKTWPDQVRQFAEKYSGTKTYVAAVNQIGSANYARILSALAEASAASSDPGPRAAVIAFFESNDFDAPNFSLEPASYGLTPFARFFIGEIGKKMQTSTAREVPIFSLFGSVQAFLFLHYDIKHAPRTLDQLRNSPPYKGVEETFASYGKTCATYKINCVLLYIPTKLRVYLPMIKGELNVAKYFTALGLSDIPDISETAIQDGIGNMEKLIGELASRNGLTFLSSTSALSGATRAHHTFWPYDTHLNAWGNEVLASLVTKKLFLNP